jgi:two-component system, NtrC family, sensor kinase
LVVDDDDRVLSSFVDLLGRDGCRVDCASDGEQALDSLERQMPCLMILDLLLPNLDGVSVLRRIRNEPMFADLAVIAVTGSDSESLIERCVDLDVADFVHKPFDRGEMRFRVRNQIKLHETRQRNRQLLQQIEAISTAAHDAVVVIDNDGRISFWNQAASQMFDYSSADAIGHNLHELIAPARYLEQHGAAFRSFRGTGHGAAIGRTLELAARRSSGEEFPVELSLSSAQIDGQWCAVGIVRDITERKREEKALQDSTRLVETVVENIPLMIFLKEAKDLRFVVFNRAGEELLGYDRKDLLGKNNLDLFPPEQAAFFQAKDREVLASGVLVDIPEEPIQTAKKGQRLLHTRKVCIKGADGVAKYLLGISEDITEQKRMEIELGHARKLEAVGQLAAGIAHEINTPTQFASDSVHFLKDVIEAQQGLVSRCCDLKRRYLGGEDPKILIAEFERAERELDLEYVGEQAPVAVRNAIEGLTRISVIVRAMKEFSHPDSSEKSAADLNAALQNTLIVARNEYKYVAEIDTQFGELPPVFCHLGALNQVFLNLIVNAAHAVADKVGSSGTMGRIGIRTEVDGELARIDISDTGTGIPDSARERIFEPFFTTKEVGRGTGQGLALARSIVCNRHGGTIGFATKVGEGTKFTVRIPIEGSTS